MKEWYSADSKIYPTPSEPDNAGLQFTHITNIITNIFFT